MVILCHGHPCLLLATLGLCEGGTWACRKSRVTWYSFSAWPHGQFKIWTCSNSGAAGTQVAGPPPTRLSLSLSFSVSFSLSICLSLYPSLSIHLSLSVSLSIPLSNFDRLNYMCSFKCSYIAAIGQLCTGVAWTSEVSVVAN